MAQACYAVDGYFFTQRLSGIQRYSTEILACLDTLAGPGEVELVTPPGTKTPVYKNIRVVEYPQKEAARGALWEQWDYPRYLRQSGRRGLCMCNVIPVRGFTGVAVLHDVCYRARPDFYKDPRGRGSALWHRLQYRLIAQKAEKIVTVSQFSKNEIQKYYGVAPGRITVVPNAWQHMERVQPDDGIFAREPRLRRGEYYFSMANLLKNKNFPWVLRAAQKKPDAVFAIAGGGSLRDAAGALGLQGLSNVFYLGYVSDGEAKALMAGCKAFLFPTLYEGFGIPPLEAVACGAPRIMVSDTPCMREVYGPYADYIDLAQNDGDVDAVRAGQPPVGLLARYSWQKSAETLLALLRQ